MFRKLFVIILIPVHAVVRLQLYHHPAGDAESRAYRGRPDQCASARQCHPGSGFEP